MRDSKRLPLFHLGPWLRSANERFYPGRLLNGPKWIVLGVNNVCNLHCQMCDVGTKFEASNFYSNLMGSNPLNMPLELIQRILEQTAQFFPRAKIGYAFTEPIIYPHLLESLSYADELDLYTTVTTNGLTLSRMSRDLAAVGLNELFISLDGPPEVHNSIRGNTRSFQAALQGIGQIMGMECPRPDVSVYCTITQWNVGHLVEFIDEFNDVQLKRLGFMHTNFTPKDIVSRHNAVYADSYPATISNMEGIDLAKMDLDVLWDEIEAIQAMDAGFPISFSPRIGDRSGLDIYYRDPGKLIGTFCNDAFRNIMIKSDGSVIPSHGRCYQVEGGNIYQQNLKEIWNSSGLTKFRKTLVQAGGLLPACSRCCSAF